MHQSFLPELKKMKINQEILEKAFSQLLMGATLLSEADGVRAMRAAEKAVVNAETNPTIEFDGEVLTFYSLTSGNKRYVTKSKCHFTCDCKGETSYHSALFELLTAYNQIEKETQNAQNFTETFEDFKKTIPAWVREIEHFNLYLLSNSEREQWYQKHCGYFSGGNRTERKPERLGSVRF